MCGCLYRRLGNAAASVDSEKTPFSTCRSCRPAEETLFDADELERYKRKVEASAAGARVRLPPDAPGTRDATKKSARH